MGHVGPTVDRVVVAWPLGRHEQAGEPSGVPGEGGEERAGGVICPVHVLSGDQRRPVVGQQQVFGDGGHAGLTEVGVGSRPLVVRGGGVNHGCKRLTVCYVGSRLQCIEQDRSQGAVRRVPVQGGRLPHPGSDAFGVCLDEQFEQETRLPTPGPPVMTTVAPLVRSASLNAASSVARSRWRPTMCVSARASRHRWVPVRSSTTR